MSGSCDLMDCSLLDSSVMVFFRQQYWSVLPFAFPGGLPNPGIESRSPTLQADSLPTELWGKLPKLTEFNLHFTWDIYQFSVQFSCSVVSNTLQPHELQHARPPCPSPTARVHPNSSPLSRWCHPAISSSVVPFSSCSQSLPASESFPVSQLFAWSGQSTGVSASASFLPRTPRADLL